MSPQDRPEFKDVTITGEVTIYKNVKIGEGSVIDGPCVLGKPPRGKKDGELGTRSETTSRPDREHPSERITSSATM